MAEQNYANHVYRPRAWLVTWLGSVLALVALASAALRAPSVTSVGLAVLALSVVSAIVLLRGFALRLQNRIIRAEMTARMTALGLGAEVGKLSLPQLVALRFASDREMPALLGRAIAESMTPDAIKRAVTDWQGDGLRT